MVNKGEDLWRSSVQALLPTYYGKSIVPNRNLHRIKHKNWPHRRILLKIDVLQMLFFTFVALKLNPSNTHRIPIKHTMQHFFLVFLGGGLGSCARYGLGVWAASLEDGRFAALVATPLALGGFPTITLCINVLGSLVIGVVVQLASDTLNVLPPEARLFLAVGLCGGFTTFSTFSLETLSLLQAGRVGASLLYASVSVVMCVVGTAAGVALIHWLGKRFLG
jgi:CrcB protein